MTTNIQAGPKGQISKMFALIDRRFRGQLALLLVVTVVVSSLEVAGIAAIFPLFQLILDPNRIVGAAWFQRIFGAVAPSQVFLWACALVLVLFIAKFAISTFAMWLKWHLQSRLYRHLSGTLLKSYLESPLPFHLQHGAMELLRNLTAYVAQATQFSLLGLIDLASDGLVCIGIFTALVFVQPAVSFAAIVFVVAVAFTYLWIGHPYFMRWGRRYKVASGKIYQIAMEAITGIKTVKVLGLEDYFERQYRTFNSEFSNIQKKNAFTSALPRQILELSAVGGLIGVIVWTVLQQRNPATIVPVLAVFAAAAYRLMPAVVRMTTTLQNLRFSHDAVEVLYTDIARTRTSVRSPVSRRARHFAREIVLKDVSFSYTGTKRPALDRINIVIRRGEAVAFVGATGAGKTTLADLILGLHKLDSGVLTIDDVSYHDPALIPRGTLGYVPQDPFLIDDTIRNNIALGIPDKEIDSARLRDAVANAALEELVRELPQGLETVVGERGVRLSGGQRQRIGIARAIYADPDILVLDEATSSIDMTTEAEISNAIARLHGTKTVIVVAHRLSTVRECDRIFYLKAGHVVNSGSYDELIRLNPEFAEMVRQMGRDGHVAYRLENT
jgi:ATP-binding cassette subfamily C protein